MISEAVGKILGMAMAYGVSSLGLFLAYVNYRKRIVKAEKVMTPRAWAVVAVTLIAIAGGVLVVTRLAEVPAPVTAPPPELLSVEKAESGNWPLVGIVLPAVIFLAATWVTAGLYRHFSKGLLHE